MRFLSAKRLVVLLAAVLATSSLVSSLSIPKNRDVEVANGAVELAKRAVKPHAVVSTSRPAAATSRPPTERASSSVRPSSSAPRPASSASSSAPSSSNMPASSSPMSAAGTTTASLPPSNATTTPTSTDSSNSTTNQASVPTGGLSTGAIAGIGAVCGVAVLGAGIFAAMRYQRKASITQTLGNKSVGQFPSPAPYPATSPFPAGNNAGYERLSDPSLSGASVPSGIIQQGLNGLGTYTVISTYTPTLGDELEIQPGDKVTIIVEYDDGWCQGINESRGKVKGVFPKHCVDYGNQGGEEVGRGKRVSSMYGSGGYRM